MSDRSVTTATPMVLCNAGYYGSLAAVRSLGRAGVPVVTVDPALMSAGRYSRYSVQHLTSPAFDATDQFCDWLINLGRNGPRRAIYATSDAVSFALALRRDELGAYYDLYQPDLDSTMRLMDKAQLIEHAKAVGIDTPDTWCPKSGSEAAKIARENGGTFVVKPRSQLAVSNQSKGTIFEAAASSGEEEFDAFMRLSPIKSTFAERYPATMLPMFQRYHPEAMEGIFSLSGFRDITGAHIVMRGANKVLQQPPRLGVGLCFEEAAIDPSLAERVVRLCERIGYYGAFELEFIAVDGRQLLIDFNGRFYNQLAFDVARGMDLPLLAYSGAVGDAEKVGQLVSQMKQAQNAQNLVFCNQFGMSLLVTAQRALRTMSRDEARRWNQWQKASGRKVVDAVGDRSDPLPAVVDGMRQILQSLRHPRSFVRQTALAQ